MNIKIYQVSAFTDTKFKGNPAAVCPLNEWIDEEIMQKIAMENNLSETAFFKKEGDFYKLRWFTPEMEIDLCGHATLASAYVIFKYLERGINKITFSTVSGEINAEKSKAGISIYLPKLDSKRVEVSNELMEAFGVIPIDAYEGNYPMVIFRDEEDVKYVKPSMDILNNIAPNGIMVTAKSKEVDFVSRFFVPNSVIQEDPVTGSAHCQLAPYWAQRLGKSDLAAKQLSNREGNLICSVLEDKVKITGKVVEYLVGRINLK